LFDGCSENHGDTWEGDGIRFGCVQRRELIQMTVRVIKNGRSQTREPATVLVFHRSRISLIDWDFFRFPEENDQRFRENEAMLTERILGIYKGIATNRSTFNGNGLVGQIDGIPTELAEHIANKISMVLEEFVESAQVT